MQVLLAAAHLFLSDIRRLFIHEIEVASTVTQGKDLAQAKGMFWEFRFFCIPIMSTALDCLHIEHAFDMSCETSGTKKKNMFFDVRVRVIFSCSFFGQAILIFSDFPLQHVARIKNMSRDGRGMRNH